MDTMDFINNEENDREFIRVEVSLPVKYTTLNYDDYEGMRGKVEEMKKGLAGLSPSPTQIIRSREWERPDVVQQDSVVIQMLLSIHRKLDRLLKLLEEKESPTFQEGLATDISGSGMRLELEMDKDIQPGDILHLNFDLPIVPPTTLEVFGKVVWAKALAEESKYSCGVQFISISEEDRDLIVRYTFLKQRILLKEKRMEKK